METKNIIVFSALSALLVVLLILFFLGGRDTGVISDTGPSGFESEPGTPQDRETKSIKLFFLADDDSRLHPEEREIYADEHLLLEMRQTLEELLTGSRVGAISAIPPETRLRDLFLTPDGVAYVDFSRDLQVNHISGSRAEISTVYAIVNTLAYNFKTVKRVFILIDGDERETLSGHINLKQPLLPRFDLIAN